MVENINDWIKAGQIAAEVREASKEWVKPGVKLLDLANQIESKIIQLGGLPAFPVNLSLNEVAAHYTPRPNDDIVLKDQVLKIDIGVHVKGAIGDTAYTVDLSGKYGKLVEASEKALENAIKIVKIGVTLGEMGKVIEDTIKSYGFQPVCNLSGHGLDLYDVHTAPSIPNYDTGDKTKLEKGQIIAIEPFATDGVGKIKDSSNAMIFCEMLKNKPIRDMNARKLLREIEDFSELPFASRWLVTDKIPVNKVLFGLRNLVVNQNIKDYPPLVEVNKGMVTQAEHTLLIDDEVKVLTELKK